MPFTGRLTLGIAACAAAACGESSQEGQDAGLDGSLGQTCAERDCRLDCSPEDTWLALSAESAGVAILNNLGDPDPVSAESVGDDRHHIFVGVAHDEVAVGSTCGGSGQNFVVMLHDATSSEIDRGYEISPEPIVSERIIYDWFGMETPTYLRVDDREYIYYCALYTSYDCRDAYNPDSDTHGINGKIIALRRTNGGPWERVPSDVAPFSPNSESQCEPEIVFDAQVGEFRLFFIADDGPDSGGLFVRSSLDPESFPAPPDGEEHLVARLPLRMGFAMDPYDGVWRFSADTYGGDEATQGWLDSIDNPTGDDLGVHLETLHSPLHDLHPEIHENAPTKVIQPGNPVFPNASDVIFFYAGIAVDGFQRVFAQRCTRR